MNKMYSEEAYKLVSNDPNDIRHLSIISPK